MLEIPAVTPTHTMVKMKKVRRDEYRAIKPSDRKHYLEEKKSAEQELQDSLHIDEVV